MFYVTFLYGNGLVYFFIKSRYVRLGVMYILTSACVVESLSKGIYHSAIRSYPRTRSHFSSNVLIFQVSKYAVRFSIGFIHFFLLIMLKNVDNFFSTIIFVSICECRLRNPRYLKIEKPYKKSLLSKCLYFQGRVTF